MILEIITPPDLVLMINIIIGNITPNSTQLVAGDMNEDDVIDVLDVVTLVNAIVNP